MAKQEEDIIYSIKLDIESTNASLKEYTQVATAASTAQKNLTTSTKESLEAAEREEKARKRSKDVVDAEAGSIKALREENKKLTEARNSTTLATEEGRKKVAEINKQLDENNAKIKDNVDAYTKQKIGIGDYSSALDKAIPGTAAFTSGISAATASAKAFIATPLGMVLAGIGLALGALTKYFQGSEEGQDRLNKIMAVGSAIMEKLMDVVENIGEAIYNAFTNPKQALLDLVDLIKTNLVNRFTALAVIIDGVVNMDFKKIGNGVLQLGTGVEDVIGKTQNLAKEITKTFDVAIEQGKRLADLQSQIDKDDRKLTVERSRVNLEVIKLRTRAISEEGDVKRATIKEAIALEEALSAKQVAIAEKRREQAALRVKLNGDDKEALKELADAEAALYDAKASAFEATLRFQKQLEQLNDEDRAKKKAQEDEDAAAAEKRRQDELDAEKKKLDDKKKLEDKARKDKEIADKAAADKELKVENIKAGGMTSLIDRVTGKRLDSQKLYNTVFKKGALGETYANTKAAAIAAFKSLAGIPIVGPILGVAAAAAATAFGLEQAVGISAIPFATGGKTRRLSGTRIKAHHGIPIRRSNGDNLLATVAIGEAIVNKEQQARLGGDAAFRKAGVPGFASGGNLSEELETRIAANATDQNSILSIVDAAISNIKPILIVDELEAKQMLDSQIKSRAQVI